MIKPTSSLLAKILGWFFLNMALVAVVLTVFFAFQPQVNLQAIFGQASANRLRAAGQLISHDLHQTRQTEWSEVLARHAAIHGVDFVLVLEEGSRFLSTDLEIPDAVMQRVRENSRRRPPPGRAPPPEFGHPRRRPPNHPVDDAPGSLRKLPEGRRPSPPEGATRRPLTMRTRQPTRYWTGIRIPVPPDPRHRPAPALLLAVSDSVTGNGFFFDPLPWLIVAVVMVLVSVLFWIPMVRSITRPLARMNRATEAIAGGNFDVAIREPRADEIGRLARAINHMTARLASFVKGQKRFLGDVAHELGSPIARIQFGLGALEQRVEGKNQRRVTEVLEDVDHLSNLVNELLAFSRADMKSKTIALEKVDLLPVVQAAVRRETTPTAQIVTKIDPALRATASAELLTRALANLIRNAVKYAGDAGPIYVTAKELMNKVAIEVRDSGPGVAEAFLDQLFEPFFRPEASRNRDSGGVGLGLAIVKTCIETCKGTVSVRNLRPKGFAVTILLIP